MLARRYTAIVTTLLLWAMPAGAAAVESKNRLEEVVVEGKYLSMDKINAIRTPTPIIDVPQSLSIFSAEQIARQGVRSVRDIIDYTAGVNTSQGEGHRDAVVFRGVRSTADFYVDGVRDDVQYYRPLYNVERVEILRGPNALLFGRGGTGGVLNRVSKKAQVGEQFTGFQTGVNSQGEYDAQIDSNVTVSDTAALRINGYYAQLENHRDFYDGERVGINPTATLELSPASTLQVSYEYIDHDRFVDRGIPTGADGEPTENFDDIVFGDPKLNNAQLEAHVFRATLGHQFTEALKGNFNAFYGDYDKVYENFYVSGYDAANTPDVVELDGYIDTTERRNLVLSSNLVGEFRTGSIGHTLLVGGEFIETSSDQDRFNAFWSTTQDDNEVFAIANKLSLRNGVGINAAGAATTNDFTVDINDDTRVAINVYSAYIQDQVEIAPWLDVVLGARFDSFDIEVVNAVADDRRTRGDEEVSPRAGVIVKPRENVSLYASYSESFLPRSGEQFDNINGASDQLDPDIFENAEIGVKWDITGSLSFTAAYFENEQTRSDRDNETGEAFEVRGLEIDGFEFQLQGWVTNDLYISSGYSYLDGATAAGDRPRELPENKAFVWGNYQATDQLGFGLGVTYQDESLITDGGAQTLPSYTRVDAAVYYDVSEKLRLQVNIENLTDEAYYPNAHSTHQVTVGSPMNALFTVSGTF